VYLPYPGVTIIWHLECTHQTCTSLPSTLDKLLEPTFVTLPARSYHVTLLDIMTMSASHSVTAAEWSAFLQVRSPRLKKAVNLLEKDGFIPTFHLKEVQVHADTVKAELAIAPKETEDVDRLVASLVEALGLDAGRRHPFHMTLAYRRPGNNTELSEEKRRELAAKVAACIGDGPIPLGKPSVCTFEDMTMFSPWNAA
jgi:hypothetical protein